MGPAVQHVRMASGRAEDFHNENVASLRPVLASAVCETIYACNAFGAAVSANIAFPADLAPGYRFFTRSYHNEAILHAQRVYRRDASPWWSDTVPESASTPVSHP